MSEHPSDPVAPAANAPAPHTPAPHPPTGWTSSPAQPGTVYLAGAGPGDPGLLTLRAHLLLQTADVLLPDDLVSPEILALAAPTAQIIPVGKRCGRPGITQAGIHQLMLLHAGRNRSVLRLKSGDPLLFGRAHEEIEALRVARIPFEIIPGITAASAAAAALERPLTDRSSASKLILATAHHAAGRHAAAWEGPFPSGSTLALYMPGRDFAALSRSLIASGIAPDTPVAAVSSVSTPREHSVLTTLAALPASQPGPAPLLLLIGPSVQPHSDSSR